jgi:hypothetical protein
MSIEACGSPRPDTNTSDEHAHQADEDWRTIDVPSAGALDFKWLRSGLLSAWQL